MKYKAKDYALNTVLLSAIGFAILGFEITLIFGAIQHRWGAFTLIDYFAIVVLTAAFGLFLFASVYSAIAAGICHAKSAEQDATSSK